MRASSSLRMQSQLPLLQRFVSEYALDPWTAPPRSFHRPWSVGTFILGIFEAGYEHVQFR